ncbi:MAG: radical SAM protein [Candidatus Omnitrophota bacterium]
MRRGRLKLLVSNKKGDIFSHDRLEASGMKAGTFVKLEPANLIKLPPGSRLFMLPDRRPVGYDPETAYFTPTISNFGVAAFLPPGYTVTYNSPYSEIGRPRPLPLFAYAAAALYKGTFHVAAFRVDKDRRHDTRFINIYLVRKNIRAFKKLFPDNRLISHLESCAMDYGCPGAQNFFLHRYEGPLPSSPTCNAVCLGCISYQVRTKCPETQPRIKFAPSSEEIAEVAIFHIENVKDTVVSFGQGCDGEPLMAGEQIERAIKLIRKKTEKGLINMNTNGSMPRILERLFDAGLDSIRVSMNSARPEYYTAYYKPAGYNFNDVIRSIDIAKKKNHFVSINYLTMPGFSDSNDEFQALKRLIKTYCIDMIQWRNLNFDPIFYFRKMKIKTDASRLIGIKEEVETLKNDFPGLMMGYFNPTESSVKKISFHAAASRRQ